MPQTAKWWLNGLRNNKPAPLLDSAILRDVCETGQCSGTGNWSFSEWNSFPTRQFSLTSSHEEFSLELIELAKAFKYFHKVLGSFWPYKANQIVREAGKKQSMTHINHLRGKGKKTNQTK